MADTTKEFSKDETLTLPKETPKDELRSKYANTFKLFDDEGPTVPVEITNVGKLKFKIEDLDPNKDKSLTHLTNTKKPSNNDSPTKNKTLNSTETVDDLSFSMNSKLKVEQKKDEINNANTTKHYKVLKFFARLTTTILDQIVILGLTYLYFLFLIKPNMIKTPYSYIEAVADFIINDNSNFKSLLIGYFLITIIYYTVFNIIIKSTPFNYLFGYKIYRNTHLASPIILIFRNILMIVLNLLLLFPYLFMFVSDDKQTIYDKIFKTYFLKEN